ncbi:unnamed protein product, partial [Didymodactylos carnosus]
MIRLSLIILFVVDTCYSDAVIVTIDWNDITHTSNTSLTLLVVENPLLRRESPIHDTVFQSLNQLQTDYTRFLTWYPYPRLAVAELEPPSGLSQCKNVPYLSNLTLTCALSGGRINKIEFASFGTPTGTCGNYTIGQCHSNKTMSVIRKLCLFRRICTVYVTNDLFDGDPCPGMNKRLAVQITCYPPQNNTYWDFTTLDPLVEDFLNATQGHSSIIDFSTQPRWLYTLPAIDQYPDSDDQVDWNYPAGIELIDKTGQQIGDYYGRLAAWYTKGGFIDEYGRKHVSNHYYNISIWEVLNEVDFEHWNGIEQYTLIYDSVVESVRKMVDPEQNIKFVGLSLGNPSEFTKFSYFLNSSNHRPNIPLDWISYHFYAFPTSRTDPRTYEQFFPQTDVFVEKVKNIETIRRALSPLTRTTINELGVILPDDNNPNAEAIPLIYWNAAAAAFAYIFCQLAPLGIDVIGSSQLVGYPQLSVLGGLSPQFPSVALLDWNTGIGNARYWTLTLLHSHFQAGSKAVRTDVSGVAQPRIYAQAWVCNQQKHKLLLINTKFGEVNVTIENSAGSIAWIVDKFSNESGARSLRMSSDTL